MKQTKPNQIKSFWATKPSPISSYSMFNELTLTLQKDLRWKDYRTECIYVVVFILISNALSVILQIILHDLFARMISKSI
jgi:hypothetical protein